MVTNSDVKKLAGLHGLRCSMIRNSPVDAEDFLQFLRRNFPHDPEVLYQVTHAYADLSNGASEQLMREAPFSYYFHELAAEQLEQQGNWDEAVAECRDSRNQLKFTRNSFPPGPRPAFATQSYPGNGGRGQAEFRIGAQN